MSERPTIHNNTSFLPFCVVLPLVFIAMHGCVEDGCQGALNAQSAALHEAYEAGGWDK